MKFDVSRIVLLDVQSWSCFSLFSFVSLDWRSLRMNPGTTKLATQYTIRHTALQSTNTPLTLASIHQLFCYIFMVWYIIYYLNFCNSAGPPPLGWLSPHHNWKWKKWKWGVGKTNPVWSRTDNFGAGGAVAARKIGDGSGSGSALLDNNNLSPFTCSVGGFLAGQIRFLYLCT